MEEECRWKGWVGIVLKEVGKEEFCMWVYIDCRICMGVMLEV